MGTHEQDRMQTFEKGGVNLRVFTKGGANLKKILIPPPPPPPMSAVFCLQSRLYSTVELHGV